MQGESVIDSCDIFEVYSIWDFEALHPICMPPLLEMHLEGPSAPVAEVTTYLALVFDSQPVKLVQPVGNRLTIPPQRQVFRVIDWSISFLALR